MFHLSKLSRITATFTGPRQTSCKQKKPRGPRLRVQRIVITRLALLLWVLRILFAVDWRGRRRRIELPPPIQIKSAAIAIIERTAITNTVFVKMDVFVGRESCAMQAPCAFVIRDLVFVNHNLVPDKIVLGEFENATNCCHAVSYTHLTLPTILLV